MSQKISIDAQISEVRREIALRRNTYPRLVGAGKMRSTEAELLTERMQAVLETLIFCHRHEADIRAFMEQKKAVQG